MRVHAWVRICVRACVRVRYRFYGIYCLVCFVQIPFIRYILSSMFCPGMACQVYFVQVSFILALFSANDLDVLALQETWHENSDSTSLRCAATPGYVVVEEVRPLKPRKRPLVHVQIHEGVRYNLPIDISIV